jgi:hypothetical protein
MKPSIGKACAIFGAVLLTGLGVQRACAQEASKDEVPSRFQHALDLFHQKRCQESWDELWRLAQTKDYYALFLLTGSLVAHPFIITGASGTELNEKMFLPMAIYATLTSEMISSPFSIETIRHSLIRGIIAYRRDGDRGAGKTVIDCFESSESPEVCVKLAIERRLIPEYDAYIATVNLINKTQLHVECETSGLGFPKEYRGPRE